MLWTSYLVRTDGWTDKQADQRTEGQTNHCRGPAERGPKNDWDKRQDLFIYVQTKWADRKICLYKEHRYIKQIGTNLVYTTKIVYCCVLLITLQLTLNFRLIISEMHFLSIYLWNLSKIVVIPLLGISLSVCPSDIISPKLIILSSFYLPNLAYSLGR